MIRMTKTVNFLNQRRFPKTITVLLPLLVVLTATFFVSPVRGETVVATIPIGTGLPNPIASGIDVDALSNLIFVADSAKNVVVMIDGYTNKVVATSQTLGNSYTYGLAVNPQTNKIFVTDASIYCCDTSRTVTVLDETTLAQVASVILPSSPAQIAVNSVTNRVYVEEYRVPAVDVMDGSTYSVVARLPVNCAPGTDTTRCKSAGIAVNHVTNKIYAAFTSPTTTSGYTTIFVIDGSTNTVTANVTYADWLLAAPPAPFGLAIDSATNMLYAVSGQDVQLQTKNSDSVHVIDASTNSIVTSVLLGKSTIGIGVDEATDRIYAGGLTDSTVLVIDGATNTLAATVPHVPTLGVAVNSATSLIYASGYFAHNVTVIAGPSPSTHATRTILTCDPGSVAVNQAAQCTATVTDTSSTPTSPTGTVSFTTNSSGTFTPSGSCTLNPASSSASSCTLSYSPDLGSDGTHRITGTYSADSTHFATRGSFNLAVTKHSTSNSVNCTGHSGKFRCTASISDTSLGLPLTPTGTVTWTSSSTSKKSAFVPPSCTLNGTGPTASCTVSYANPGKSMTVTITATYSGDAGHFGSTGSTTLTT